MSEQQNQPQKEKPTGIVIPPKKPKLSKAERRALQEQQRAAKSAGRGGKPQKKPQQQQQQQEKQPAEAEPKRQQAPVEAEDPKQSKRITLLAHLPPYRDPQDHPDQFLSVQLGGAKYKGLHPAVLKTGLAYATTNSQGNPRCRAMLRALIQALQDFVPPADGDLRHHINNQLLKPSFTYWTTECRPHSVSMGNAFTFVKSAVAALDREMNLDDAKAELKDNMEAYILERIDYADKAIAQVACDKIVDGDVILTYGNYEVIPVVLKEAAKTKKFRVIVVDSKPLLEGRDLLYELRQAGLDCTYILLNALSFVMKDVTKVLLGAEALMNDGSIYARVGTACVAMTAKGKPVLVCAETYKISNRVQLEAITSNELGDPQHVVPGELGDNLRVINLIYDLTPADFVSGIVTEMGILPATSVAVLLREMNPQDAYNAF